MKLTNEEIKFIADCYNAGACVADISFHTGLTQQGVKRALHEAHLMYLSWNKTKDENEILTYLLDKGITKLEQLRDFV